MLLEVKNLKKYYLIRSNIFSRDKGFVRAVDGVSFSIDKGETLSLIGESGCGKTTIGKLILRLIEPTEGEILFKGQSILKLNNREMRRRRKDMQIIFQDPYGSLDPMMTAGDIIGEAIEIHNRANKNDRNDMVRELLIKVGLPDNRIDCYPHEFSGGQRQRICIARAIALKPEFIVCDEPVSSLDVLIMRQIIDLLEMLQEEYGISYLFIAHDLAIVERISDIVAVMFKGKIVETARLDELYQNPLHPYTRLLFAAIPSIDHDRGRKCMPLYNDLAYHADMPSLAGRLQGSRYGDSSISEGQKACPEQSRMGCSFLERCPEAISICRYETPELFEAQTGHLVACHKMDAM